MEKTTTKFAADANEDGENYFLWLSDIHFDPYYSTPQAFKTSYYDANCDDEDAPIFGRYDCDSPRSLVISALEHAVNVASARTPSSPAFVIVSGDSIRHGVDKLFSDGEFKEGAEARNPNNATATGGTSPVQEAANAPFHNQAMEVVGEILQELVSMLNYAFPESEVIVSLGNNDVVPDYYLELPQGRFDDSNFATTLTPESAGMVGVLFNAMSRGQDDTTNNITTTTLIEELGEGGASPKNRKTIMNADDQSAFLRGGYYSRTLHDGTLTIISLNTVLYSGYFEPTFSEDGDDDPGMQFSWMRNLLSNCRDAGTQAIIVGHIPPAMGSYRHTQLWREGYIQSYYEIIKEFDNVVIAQLYGHLHSDEFRVGFAENETDPKFSMIPSMNTPILLGGSITPLHSNDPSFRLVKYDRGGGGTGAEGGNYRLLDYDSYRLSIGMIEKDWSKLYTFSEAYNMVSGLDKEEGLTSEAFCSIVKSMEDKRGKESSVLKLYRSLMRSGADGDDNGGGAGANVKCGSTCRDEFQCTFRSATKAGYQKCLLEQNLTWNKSGRSIFGLVGAVLFGTAALVFVIVRCKKRSKRDDYESTPSVTGNAQTDEVDMNNQEMI